MRQDAWRAYLEMALGLTEASRKKATKAVRQVLGRGGATAEQLQELAEELIRTSATNRDAMTKLIRYELDRALGRVGLATADEVTELTSRVHQLEGELAAARGGTVVGPPTDEPGAAEPLATVTPITRSVTPTPAKKAVKKA